jgi:uncharacterized protein (TIGR02266 family)
MGANKKILIVDDTRLFRELEAVFLARAGEVLTAASGEDGLQVARREMPDVIVADMDMPGMDGDTLCRAIKADRDLHATPVILVVGMDSAGEHARAVGAHADDILAKPLSRIQLNVAVARLLRDRSTRGLTRVGMASEVRVRLSRADSSAWGVARDLSRGGIFIESHGRLPVDTEVDLDFRLPNQNAPLRPTARVIWSGKHPKTGLPGMGLRFVRMDRTSTDRIDAFVHEWGPAEATASRSALEA